MTIFKSLNKDFNFMFNKGASFTEKLFVLLGVIIVVAVILLFAAAMYAAMVLYLSYMTNIVWNMTMLTRFGPADLKWFIGLYGILGLMTGKYSKKVGSDDKKDWWEIGLTVLIAPAYIVSAVWLALEMMKLVF